MFDTLQALLSRSREHLWGQFRLLRKVPVPKVKVPHSPNEAIKLGYRLGLQEGYCKGLVDGVGLGMDVGALPTGLAHFGDPELLS